MNCPRINILIHSCCSSISDNFFLIIALTIYFLEVRVFFWGMEKQTRSSGPKKIAEIFFLLWFSIWRAFTVDFLWVQTKGLIFLFLVNGMCSTFSQKGCVCNIYVEWNKSGICTKFENRLFTFRLQHHIQFGAFIAWWAPKTERCVLAKSSLYTPFTQFFGGWFSGWKVVFLLVLRVAASWNRSDGVSWKFFALSLHPLSTFGSQNLDFTGGDWKPLRLNFYLKLKPSRFLW